MKLNPFIFVPLAALVIWGCGNSEQPQTSTNSTAEPPKKTAPSTQEPAGAHLGTPQEGDHFTVTLSSEPAELKVGKAKFIAKVEHHGQPTTEANVKLSLLMPTMNMGGPDLELKHISGGTYEGEADLSMGGDWQAKVSVDQEGHPGEATYRFVVMQ